jgi:hypothetical protein
MTPEQIAQIRKQIGITENTPQAVGASNVARRRQLAAEYDAQQAEANKPKGIVGGLYNLGKDIAETGGALKGTFQKTVGKIGEAGEAMKSGEQGLLRTIGQSAGIAAGGVSGAIGDVMTGGVKAALPEAGEQAVKSGIAKVAPAIMNLDEMAGSPIANLMAKYESLDDKSKRDIDAVLGIGSLALDLSGMGLTKKAGQVGLEKTGQAVAKTVAKTAEVAGKVGEVAKPLAEGAINMTKGIGRSISNIPTKIGTNLAEKQTAIKAVESLPTPLARKTASLGVDVADVNTLLKIPQEIKQPVKNLLQSVKDFSSGVSKVRPEEVVGKPITQALKNLDSKRITVGKQLGDIAKNLGVVSEAELFQPVFDKLSKVVDGLTIKNGKLNFKNTVLSSVETASDRKAIQSIFEQAVKWGTGEKKHKLRQELFEILGGKKKSLTNITATQEKAYEAIRQGLSDVLDTKNPAYKTLNTEYAKIVQPLADLRKMMKGIVGADEDILNMSAGLLARRLTSNAPSNPQLRNILRSIDTILKDKTLPNLEGLQDVYNILDRYYDIAAKTGFQGQIKTGIEKAGDIWTGIAGKVGEVAGETPAVRQKAIEDFLNEILK